MWNEPTEEELAKLPPLYSTEDTPLEDKVIYMHFFTGPANWWMAEYSPEQRLFFGYADLGDPEMAEWGYIDYDELRELRYGPGGASEVDRDLYWEPKPVREIPEIRKY